VLLHAKTDQPASATFSFAFSQLAMRIWAVLKYSALACLASLAVGYASAGVRPAGFSLLSVRCGGLARSSLCHCLVRSLSSCDLFRIRPPPDCRGSAPFTAQHAIALVHGSLCVPLSSLSGVLHCRYFLMWPIHTCAVHHGYASMLFVFPFFCVFFFLVHPTSACCAFSVGLFTSCCALNSTSFERSRTPTHTLPLSPSALGVSVWWVVLLLSRVALEMSRIATPVSGAAAFWAWVLSAVLRRWPAFSAF
jgi:hypothetical protein